MHQCHEHRQCKRKYLEGCAAQRVKQPNGAACHVDLNADPVVAVDIEDRNNPVLIQAVSVAASVIDQC